MIEKKNKKKKTKNKSRLEEKKSEAKDLLGALTDFQ